MRLRATRMTGMRQGSTPSFAIASLFGSGEQGVWFDASDMSTMYQDAAGTVPVTAVEQPVGLWRDKSGNNAHASQATSTKRPVLSAKYNVLSSSEQITSAAPWYASAFTITNGALACPSGPAYLTKLTATASPGVTYYYTSAPSSSFKVSMYVSVGTRPYLELLIRNGTTATNYNAGYIDSSGTVSGGTWVATPLGGGIFRVETTVTTGFTAGDILMIYYGATNTVTQGLFWYVGGLDVRVANDGVGIPVYQRVSASTDYDTVGFPKYLKFDGVDDFLQTSTIDLSLTNKATCCAAFRKLSDAAGMVVAELSPDLNTSAGGFYLLAPSSAGATNIAASSKGTVASYQSNSVSQLAAPVSALVSLQLDIAAPALTIRRNGTLAVSNAQTQGSGNYGAWPLYIGARSGSNLPFSGRIYSILVRGAATNVATVVKTESILNSISKLY